MKKQRKYSPEVIERAGEQECRVILPVPSRSKSTGLFLA
jgi:hypothetical protein